MRFGRRWRSLSGSIWVWPPTATTTLPSSPSGTRCTGGHFPTRWRAVWERPGASNSTKVIPSGCIATNTCAAWTARCRTSPAWTLAAAARTATTSQTRTARRARITRTAARPDLIRARGTVPRARVSTTTFDVLEIASNDWMRSCAAEIKEALRPSAFSAPMSTTNCSCCKPCGRCFRTPGSSPPISTPCCFIRPARAPRATS